MQFMFVMEYLEGGELKEYISQKGFLEEEEAQSFFRQIVDAVYYCHLQQIIHRDLKLENILLESLESKKIKVITSSTLHPPPSSLVLHLCPPSPLLPAPSSVLPGPCSRPPPLSFSQFLYL